MAKDKFTPQAAVLWSTIPEMGRERILASVFCVKCGGAVQMIDFSGKEERGNLILEGFCGKCGNAVARLVETSERDKSRN